MKSFHRVAFLVGLYLCSVLIVAVPAQAQIPAAAVSMNCSPGEVRVEVKPGSSYSGYTTCTVTNPTTYIEKVNIQVTSDGLAVAHAGDVYVGAGQDVDFQVVVRADPYMAMQSRQLSVTGTVTEINSVPPVNVASSQTNVMVNIMQFSLVQVEAVEPFVQLMPKTDKPFEFKVTNLGNQIDFMRIGITDDSREKLEEDGFTINLPAVKTQIENNPAGQKVRVLVRTPKDWGWTDQYYTMNFYAESEFSCKNGGCERESQMITIYVRGVYLPGFEVVPTLSMVALAAAMAGRSLLRTEEEEGVPVLREAAPGL